jgi:hypothetical protein
VIEGNAVDSDFWDKLVVSGHLKLVLLDMPSHAGNVYALQQLQHRAFAGRLAAIVKYSVELEPLRALGADAVLHVVDEAGPFLPTMPLQASVWPRERRPCERSAAPGLGTV